MKIKGEAVMNEHKLNTNMPIRVLQVIGSMNLGGAEAMIMNLYRKMDRDKVQFDFLLQTSDKSVYEEEIESLGGKIYRIKKFKGRDPIRYYRNCCCFFQEHPEISVVHGHIGSSAAIYLSAAKKYGCYTIAHSHNALGIKSLRDFLFFLWSYPTRRIADQLFGCSTEAGIARYGKKAVASERYRNFNNGIDITRFTFSEERRDKIRNEFNIANKMVIGTVGRLTTQKNPKKIFEIFRNIVLNAEDVVCLWVGTGEMWDQFHTKVLAEGLSEKIIMTGPRTDVPDILQAFDVFLFPSFWEGLPVSVIEAQAAGLPCILSDSISKEVGVSNLVQWMNINDHSKAWAEKCLSAAKLVEEQGRACPVREIQESGYDINFTSAWLQDLYLAKGKGHNK